MDFTIYSMGDPEFIRLALLGLSHAFEQGAISVAKIGLMLGLLAIFWKGIWAPDKIEFKQFFMGFFLVIILFGKQVPVTLIHNDGAGADAMPPIPIGLALSGTIATNFGYNMANSLRDFYHTTYLPGNPATGSYLAMISNDGNNNVPVAGNGLEPLRELLKMRFDGSSKAFNGNVGASVPTGVFPPNFSDSLDNYIHDCVLKDIFNGRSVQEVEEGVLSKSPYAWAHMKVDYDGWGTTLKLDSGHGWTGYGCKEAYQKLDNYINTDLKAMINEVYSLKGERNQAMTDLGAKMLGTTNSEAWKIKTNQLMHYHYNKTKAKSRWASDAELAASQVEFEAIDKRRISSGVQHSLWSEMAIPLMTYIEAFVFLIGPIMPFVIAFGEKGAGLVLKYFFILIWVNTWPILQVGVNMYLQNYINKASFANGNYDPFSWAGYNTTFTEVESFIAMGSTLQTMVPALSLMLLYGSAHTMINVANSANKGGGSEGAAATPTAAAPSHSGKTAVGNTNKVYDSQTGSTITSTGQVEATAGMKDFQLKTDLGVQSQKGVTAAKEQVESAAVSRMNANSKMSNMLNFDRESNQFMRSDTANSSRGLALAENFSNQLMKTGHYSAESAKALGFALSGAFGADMQAKASAALKLPNFAESLPVSGALAIEGSAGMSVKAKSQLDDAIKSATGIKTAAGDNYSFGESKEGKAAMANAIAISNSKEYGNNSSWGKVGQQTEQAADMWQEANKRVEQETRAQSALNAISSNMKFNNMPVTSSNAGNHVDDRLADGTLLANNAKQTAFGAMSESQRDQFEKFKSDNQFGKGLEQDMKALKAFSETDGGRFLNNMSESFKTPGEYKNEFSNHVGKPSTLNDYRVAVGKYADHAFNGVLDSYGTNRYSGAANLLDTMNTLAGGRINGWETAANDLRKIDAESKQELAMEKPRTAAEAGGPTKEQIIQDRQNLETAAKDSQMEKKRELDSVNVESEYEQFRTKTKGSFEPNQDKLEESKKIIADAEIASEKAKPIEEMTKPLENATSLSGQLLSEHVAPTAVDVVEGVNAVAGKISHEDAAAKLENRGIDSKTAELLSGQNSQTTHSDITEIVSRGLQAGASGDEKLQASKLLAGAITSESVISDLNASGKPDNIEAARELEANKNSVMAAFGLGSEQGDKNLIKHVATELASGSGTEKGALYTLEPEHPDLRTSLSGREEQHTMQQRVLEQMEINGQTDSSEYKELKGEVAKNGQYLEERAPARAFFTALKGYDSATKDSPDNAVAKQGANELIQGAIVGKDGTDFKNLSFAGTLSEHDSNDIAKALKLDDIKGNADLIRDYEQMRPGLVGALNELQKKPEFESYAENLSQKIEQLDQQSGFNHRAPQSEHQNTVLSEPRKVDAEFIPSKYGDGERINVPEASFDDLHKSENGAKFDVGGELFTKVSSQDGGMRTVELAHIDSGESYSLYRSNSGEGNLTIESKDNKF